MNPPHRVAKAKAPAERGFECGDWSPLSGLADWLASEGAFQRPVSRARSRLNGIRQHVARATR
jgi:hypothetical protein